MPNAQFDPSQLADIHLPENIGIWPIAPGWWLLLALFILLCVLIFLFSKENKNIKKSLSPKQLRRLALKELTNIEKNYQFETNPHETVTQLSIFLRRFALSHYHREQVASLTEKKWLSVLDEMFNPAKKKQVFSHDFTELLTEAPYQSHNTALDAELIKQLFNTAKTLVRNYRKVDNQQDSKHV